MYTRVFIVERRCDGPVIFVKEENKRLGGPFEVDIFANLSLIECQAQCLRAEKWVIKYSRFRYNGFPVRQLNTRDKIGINNFDLY